MTWQKWVLVAWFIFGYLVATKDHGKVPTASIALVALVALTVTA